MEEAHKIERRLTAILSADVRGYSRMMAEDEHATVRAIQRCREIVDTHVREHHGRIVDAPGDNILAEFPSAVEAVRCAVEVQRELVTHNAELVEARRMQFRIGIHVGDVLSDDGRIYGDGVNIAARLEALATPGGICISREVHDQIRGKLDIDCEDIGEQQVKNVPRPVRVLRVRMDSAPAPAQTADASRLRRLMLPTAAAVAAILLALASWRFLRTKPAAPPPAVANRTIRSIAILPLENFSGDPSQEYFADGMTEQLTTDLAQISALRVISRTSVMQFKGDHRKPLPEIAKLLNVDAVVEGSVLRIGDKVRITAQLIDAFADKHLWAQSYERDTRDVFAMQDEIASSIARAVNAQLTPDEQRRLSSAKTVDPKALEAQLKGIYQLNKFTTDGFAQSEKYFEQVIQIAPDFVGGYAGLAAVYYTQADVTVSNDVALPKAKELIQKAMLLDDSLWVPHFLSAAILWSSEYKWAAAESEYRRAIELAPNEPDAHRGYGFMLRFLGRFDEAEREYRLAEELNPLSPNIFSEMGELLNFRGEHAKALEQCRAALALAPDFWPAHSMCLGWTYAGMGNSPEALKEMERGVALERNSWSLGSLGIGLAHAGKRDDALRTLAELDQLSGHSFVNPVWYAYVYLALGENDRALDFMEKAYREGAGVVDLRINPSYDPIRSNPRFIALLKKTGLNQ